MGGFQCNSVTGEANGEKAMKQSIMAVPEWQRKATGRM